MKKLLAVLLCVSLVLGGVSSALAQSGPTGNDGDTPVHRLFLPSVSNTARTTDVTKVIPLQPESALSAAIATQLDLREVKAAILRNGSVRIDISGNYNVNFPQIAYAVEIDMTKSTYRLKIVDSTQIPGATLDMNASALSGTNSARVSMHTKDPAWLTLATTTDFLRWNYNGSTVQWTEYNDACWAANPSPANTHWYTTFCSNSSPVYFNNSSEVCNWAIGDYINWDFLDPNQSTQAHHWIKVCGQNSGNYSYQTQYWDEGEASWLIFHIVTLN